MEQKTVESFKRIYGYKPGVLCFAPGRVNLIGEHTDYNGGYVMPFAINMGIYCAAKKTGGKRIRLYSANFTDDGITEVSLDNLALNGSWTDYPIGVIKTFKSFGYEADCGADFFFYGNLPDGAGLSSSASLEVVTGTALCALYGFKLSKQLLAYFGQFAENRYIGVNCGIMDQFASALGKADNAVLLNTNTLDFSYAPVMGASLVLINSGVKHSLASSAYNDRRKECETAAKELEAPFLCSVSVSDFEALKERISDSVVLKRARHVISENERTINAAKALKENDVKRLGKLMNASHISLKEDYEVSCDELDFLAESAQRLSFVYGSRMTGGGFGGCTINLVEQGSEDEFIDFIKNEYKNAFGITASAYKITPGDGARVIIKEDL